MTVDCIDWMGSDATVAQAARVSFRAKDYNDIERNNKLVKYLAEHNHWTPFAHCFATFKVAVPIFVARQWFKHTVGFAYNEVSRRYVKDTPDLYEASIWRTKPEGNIKQGSSSKVIQMSTITRTLMAQAREHYEDLIEQGVAPEMARMVLPQATMTEFIVSGSLAAWSRFYDLRSDDHAQAEIRWCAKQISEALQDKGRFPVSWAALCKESQK